MDAKIAPAVALSSPAAAQRCAEGTGLLAARWPQHNPPCRRLLPAAAPTTDNLPPPPPSMAPQLHSQIYTSLTDASTRKGGPSAQSVSPGALVIPAVDCRFRWCTRDLYQLRQYPLALSSMIIAIPRNSSG